MANRRKSPPPTLTVTADRVLGEAELQPCDQPTPIAPPLEHPAPPVGTKLTNKKDGRVYTAVSATPPYTTLNWEEGSIVTSKCLTSEEIAAQFERQHDRLAELEQERDAIKAEGTIAPAGCWIETGEQRPGWRQVWWRSSVPMFPPKRSRGDVATKITTCYIGKQGSPEHKEAIDQKKRRDRLVQLNKQIELLEKEIES